MDDKNIINILKSDEEKGYELMIHKYTPYISTIVYNMTNSFLSSSDMKEIVADVFFKLWKNRHIIEGDSLKEILIKTTRNTCLDHYKKNKQIFIPLDDDVLQKSNMDTLHSIHEKKNKWKLLMMRWIPSENLTKKFLFDFIIWEKKSVKYHRFYH